MTVTLTSLSPAYVPINTEAELAIIGSGFTKTTTTLFVDGAQATFEYVSDTAIKAIVESAEAGTVKVEAEKNGARSNALDLTFTAEATDELSDDTVDTAAEEDEVSQFGPLDPYPTGTPYYVPTAGVAMNAPPPIGWAGANPSGLNPPQVAVPNSMLNPA
jgi:hypothetical protein